MKLRVVAEFAHILYVPERNIRRRIAINGFIHI